jgi:hypothetical protein
VKESSAPHHEVVSSSINDTLPAPASLLPLPHCDSDGVRASPCRAWHVRRRRAYALHSLRRAGGASEIHPQQARRAPGLGRSHSWRSSRLRLRFRCSSGAARGGSAIGRSHLDKTQRPPLRAEQGRGRQCPDACRPMPAGVRGPGARDRHSSGGPLPAPAPPTRGAAAPISCQHPWLSSATTVVRSRLSRAARARTRSR